MKKLGLKLMSIVLALSAVLFAFSLTINFNFAKADNAQTIATGLTMDNGAYVRAPKGEDKSNSGIRFVAKVSDEAIDALKAEANGSVVYLGIKITYPNGATQDLCGTVIGHDKLGDIEKSKYSELENNEYAGSILYTRETLETNLIASLENKADKDADQIADLAALKGDDEAAKTTVLDKYLNKIYGTELTATPYYTIDTNTVYLNDNNPQTRSIWAVAAEDYASNSEYALGDTYFKVPTTPSVDSADKYIEADGSIVGEEIADETKFYANASAVTVNNNKISTAALAGKAWKDKINFSAVSSYKAEIATKSFTYVTKAIDEASDFSVFNLDEEYTLQDGTTKIGEVVGGYYIMTKDIDANNTNMGLDHSKKNVGTSGRYHVANGVLGVGFVGEFDGNGHIIKNFAPSEGGLFGRLSGAAVVRNLGFYNLNASNSTYAIAYRAQALETVLTSADQGKYNGLTINERNALYKKPAAGASTANNTYLEDIYVHLSAAISKPNGVLIANDGYDMRTNYKRIVIDASNYVPGSSDTYSLFLTNNAAHTYGEYDDVAIITNGPIRKITGHTVYGNNNKPETLAAGEKAYSWMTNYATYDDFYKIAQESANNFLAFDVWKKTDNVIYFGDMYNYHYAYKTSVSAYIQPNGAIIGTDLTNISKLILNDEEVDISAIGTTDDKGINPSKISSYKVKDVITLKEPTNKKLYNLKYVTLAIDEASDFEVFDMDTEYTLQDGTTKVGEVIDGYYVMINDIDANNSDMGLTHDKKLSGTNASRYSIVGSGILGNGFVGEFDGQGHIIKNFVPSTGGLFGRLAGAAVVQNVGFYNLKLTSATSRVIAYNGQAAENIVSSTDTGKYNGLTINERNALYKYPNKAASWSDDNRCLMQDIFVHLSSDSTCVSNGVIIGNDLYDADIIIKRVVIDSSKVSVASKSGYSYLTSVSTAVIPEKHNDIRIISDGNLAKSSSLTIYGVNQDHGLSTNDKITEGKAACSNTKIYSTYASLTGDDVSAFTGSAWTKKNGVLYFGNAYDLYNPAQQA